MDTKTIEKLLACKRCRRLQHQFKKLKVSHPEYWNGPVPPSGNDAALLLVVGLAPGMHGANKSGLPFIGDASGDLLYKVLGSLAAIDRVRITNAVKCLPIKNSPSGQELKNCARYLQVELAAHSALSAADLSPVVLALGGVAHRAIIRTLAHRQVDHVFAHGVVHRIGDLTLVDSYHCSRYNTQTGRLTEPMFMDVVREALRLTQQ